MQNKNSSVVLVTGGAKNLGRAIALLLAQSGYGVCVHFRQSQKEAEEVVKECQSYGVFATSIQGDFSTKEGIFDCIERYQKLNLKTRALVNNVGAYFIKSALSTTKDEAEELFQTNLFAPFFLSQALSASLQKEQGSIIMIGTSGLFTARADSKSALYTASKHALYSLTKSLAKELAPSGVRVNMVSPGQLEVSIGLPPDMSFYPMKRPGKAEEVARVVAFLLDEKNRYITGQNIEVAGGLGL
jgi:NAD(P)-dependent dehydrogenase (short-subunit alcohol dehydrogenase family)